MTGHTKWTKEDWSAARKISGFRWALKERFDFLDRLGYWDIQLNIVLNPLNWSIGYRRYCSSIHSVNLGPVGIMIYAGSGLGKCNP